MAENVSFKSSNNLKHQLIQNYDGYSFLVTTNKDEYDIPITNEDPTRFAYQFDAVLNNIYEALGNDEYIQLVKKYKKKFDRIKYKNDFTFMRFRYFESFHSISKKQQKELKSEDILAVEYVSHPMPSAMSFSTMVGYFDESYVSMSTDSRITYRELSEQDFLKLREDFITIYKIQDWKRSYNNPNIIDGHFYKIVFYLKNERIMLITGDNAYPENFEDFINRLGNKS